MQLLKKITILLCFLSLIAFISCSAEDKSGVKEKDNADGTEITGGGKSGNSGTDGGSGTGGNSGTDGGSGTGGTSGTGEGSGTGGSSETGGGSGTGGGTETTEEGNFYPPFGDYKYREIGYSSSGEDLTITKVSKVDENTTKIKGHANSYGGAKRFDFDISKWKKTIKDGKDIKSEAIEIKDNDNGYKDISIVYYYDSSTLEITFKSVDSVKDCLFKGKKISE
ncbi:hypothetical protein [uncultured Brachyspira sp.]|uniref:hypothetical protein n=1 Tax=uncultured Brachyspira sp. TaxID=221953 RepID=UPI0025949E28|nr:hypothetical protein [uncultured Brachyspira sp.]